MPNKVYIHLVLLSAILALNACAHGIHGNLALDASDTQRERQINRLAAATDDTGPADLLTKLGWARWMVQNDSATAEAAWKEAAQLSANDPEPRFALGVVNYFQARVPESQHYFLDAIRVAPESPYTETALGFLAEFFSHTSDFPQKVGPLLSDLLDDPRLSFRSRVAATEILVDIARENGDPVSERRLLERLGRFRKVAIIGPFGTFGLTDFDKTFPPESGPIAAHYEGASGDITPVLIDADKESVRLSELSDYGGVFYIVGMIRAPKSVDAVARLATQDLCTLFIDDQMVGGIDPRTGYPSMLLETRIHFSEGWHKVLLKFGDRQPYLSYQLNFTAADGQPLALEMDNNIANNHDYSKTRLQAKAVAHTAQNDWQSLAEQTRDIRHLFMSALASFQIRDHERIKPILESLEDSLPAFAPLYVLRAFQVVDDPSIPTQIAQDRARKALRKAVSLDDKQALADYQLIMDDLDKDRVSEAISGLKKLKQQIPNYYLWDKSLFELYESKGWYAETEKAATQGLALNPRDIDFLSKVQQYQLQRGRFEQAETYVRAIDKIDGPNTALSDWLEDRKDWQGAVSALRSVLEWEPWREDIQRRLALLQLRMGDLDTARRIFLDLETIPGNKGRYARQISDIDLIKNKGKEAVARLSATLKEKPNRFNLRSSLAYHDGKELLADYAIDGMQVINAYKKEGWNPEAGAVIVLDEYVIKINPDGSHVGRTHIITQVLTKEAQSRFGEVHLPQNVELYQLRVIKPDGRILIPDQIDNKRSISMPDLDEGDFIEYDYADGDGPDVRINGGNLFSARFVFRTVHVPTYHSRFIVITPKGRKVNLQELNYAFNPPKKMINGTHEVVSYVNMRLDAITPEPFMPVEEEILPMVAVTLPLTWKDIQNYYQQRISILKRESYELKNFLHAHTTSSQSEYDMVYGLYRAIAEAVEGDDADNHFNLSAAHILQNKKGNRLLLLSTLLDMAGIENRFLLGKPSTIPTIPYTDANMKTYTEALLQVTLPEGQQLLLEGNFRESVFNNPSPLLSGTLAMNLGDGESFIRLPAWNTLGDDKKVYLVIDLKENGAADCEATEEISGYYSTNLRRYLKQLPPEQISKFFEMILNRKFPGTTLLDLNIENTDNPEEVLRIHYSFHVARMARPSDDRLRIENPIFPVDLSMNYIKLPSREYPLLINGVNSGFNVVQISPPEGYAIDQLPQSAKIDTPFGSYNQVVRRENGKVIIEREMAIPIGRIGLDSYIDFYRFCNSVDRLERQPIQFVGGLELTMRE